MKLNTLFKIVALSITTVIGVLSAAQDTAPQHTVHVATWNIYRDGSGKHAWEYRRDPVIQRIVQERPDIFGAQEVTPQQMQDLREKLPDYGMVGEGRGESFRLLKWIEKHGKDEATPILFNKEKYELLTSETFSINKPSEGTIWTPLPFKTRFTTPYEDTGLLPRICTGAHFRDKETGATFWVYNTHLDHMFDRARELSAQVIRKHMESQQDPIILMGDFNTEFAGTYLEDIFDNCEHARSKAAEIVGGEYTQTGWHDSDDEQEFRDPIKSVFMAEDAGESSYQVLRDELAPADYANSAKKNNYKKKKIDHILVSKGASQVLKYAVDDDDSQRPRASDHSLVSSLIALRTSLPNS